jgi:apolipoprotein N-acyltransferase
MRAIETRRWVIRSANTGVSAIIDPEGQIIESKPWAVTAAIRFPVPAETELTFYTRYGDCISKMALALTVLFWIWHFITIIKTRKGRG